MANNYSKKVRVTLDFIYQHKGLSSFQKEALSVFKRQQFYDKWTKKLGVSQSQLNKIMKEAGLRFDRFGNVVNQAGVIQKRFGNILESNKRAAYRFRMEFLGIMFGGMALNRVMKGLNQTSREWVGWNEIVGDTLGVVTLPATLALLEKGILPLSEALMNLSEGSKMAIGITVTGLEVVGKGTELIGQTALGLYALQQLFPNAFKKQGGIAKVGMGVIGAAAGLSLGIIGLTIAKEGIKKEDFKLKLQGALEAGLGAAIFSKAIASAAGATLATTGALAIGTITLGGVLLWEFTESIKKEGEKPKNRPYINPATRERMSATELYLRGYQGTLISAPQILPEDIQKSIEEQRKFSNIQVVNNFKFDIAANGDDTIKKIVKDQLDDAVHKINNSVQS